MTIEDRILLRSSTDRKTKVRATTKDKVPIVAAIEYSYAWTIRTKIWSDNCPAAEKIFSVAVRHSKIGNDRQLLWKEVGDHSKAKDRLSSTIVILRAGSTEKAYSSRDHPETRGMPEVRVTRCATVEKKRYSVAPSVARA